MRQLSTGEQRCHDFSEWMNAKWAELHDRPGLGSIKDTESGWEAHFDDTAATCPHCGHVVLRPKNQHVRVIRRNGLDGAPRR